jgi:hypothetical protein
MTSHYASLFSFYKRTKSIASRCQIRDRLRETTNQPRLRQRVVPVVAWNILSQIVFDVNCFGDTADVWVRWRLFAWRKMKTERQLSTALKSVFKMVWQTRLKTKLLSEVYKNCGLNMNSYYQKFFPILKPNTNNNHQYHQWTVRPWFYPELFKLIS